MPILFFQVQIVGLRANSATQCLPPSDPSDRACHQPKSRASSFNYTPVRQHSLSFPRPSVSKPRRLTFSSTKAHQIRDVSGKRTMADNPDLSVNTDSEDPPADAPMTQEVALQLTQGINNMIQQLLQFNQITQPNNSGQPDNRLSPYHIQPGSIGLRGSAASGCRYGLVSTPHPSTCESHSTN